MNCHEAMYQSLTKKAELHYGAGFRQVTKPSAPLSVSVFRRRDAELLFEAFAEIMGVGDTYTV